MKFFAIVCLTVLATLAAVARAEDEEVQAYPGLHQLFGNERITNGQNAVANAHPYQISLWWGWSVIIPSSHVCGGSIISNRWVVTAAHCFTELPNYGTFTVWAGKHALNVNEATQQSRTVAQRFIHPSYLGGVNPHDIALIRLSSALTLNAAVAAIALPAVNTVHTGNAVLTGWGSVSLTSQITPATILQTVTVPVLTNSVCGTALNRIFRDPPFDASRLDNVCSGPLDNSRVSACRGDSGGPLAQRVNGVWQLVGVVSWGAFPCGTVGAPSVYVRTSAYISWINQQIAANS